MILFGRKETSSPRSCNLPKLLGKEVANSSPGLLVSNPQAPRLHLFYMACLPTPLGILVSLFPLDLRSLEYQYSLLTSLVRIKENSTV